MSDDNLKPLNVWDTDLRIIAHAHYAAAVSLGRRTYQFGVPVIILSTIIGTSVFATIQNSPEMWVKISVGLINFLVALLVALQTFLKYSERAEQHRKAGARYGSLLKELEQYIVIVPSDDEFKIWISDFRKRWDDLSIEAPTVPKRIWNKYYNKYKK